MRGRRRTRIGGQPVEDLEQLDGLDPLGHVSVHVGVETVLAISLHGMRVRATMRV